MMDCRVSCQLVSHGIGCDHRLSSYYNSCKLVVRRLQTLQLAGAGWHPVHSTLPTQLRHLYDANTTQVLMAKAYAYGVALACNYYGLEISPQALNLLNSREG
jgi:hypothetical protein